MRVGTSRPTIACTTALALCLALALAGEVFAGPVPAIPAGQDVLAADMLAEGETLASACRLRGAVLDRTFIRAEYQCGSARAVVELRHVTDERAGALRTEAFSITAGPGTPQALVEAVAERVAARESRWRWSLAHETVTLAASRGTRRRPEPAGGSRLLGWLRSPGRFALAVLAVSGAATLTTVVAARRRRQPKGN